jgi:GNAT superfamily N-acetyltransferase
MQMIMSSDWAKGLRKMNPIPKSGSTKSSHNMGSGSAINFRRFKPKDAAFCFRIRSHAFVQEFNGELNPEAVTAGVNAYLPDDYIQMAEQVPFFIVEQDGVPLGFFVVRQMNNSTAELLLIYIDLNHLGFGIGKSSIQFIEKWLSANWPEIHTLIVDTVIPEYNSGFYRKLGFIPIKETLCDFSGLKVNALRMGKKISHV